MQPERPYFRRRAAPIKRVPKKNKLTPEQKREVKAIIAKDLEPKYFTTDIATASILLSTSLVTYPLSAIPQGVDVFARTGNDVTVDWLDIRLQMSIGDLTFNTVRAILWQYIDFTGPLSSGGAGVLLNNGPNGATTYEVTSQYNMQRKDSFRILKDECFELCSSASNQTRFIHWQTKVRTFKDITFLGVSTTSLTNGIFLSFLSDSATAPHPTVTGQCRLFYTDA